jgi:hypothetical protein
MGSIGCFETSVTYYQSTLCEIPEKWRSHGYRWPKYVLISLRHESITWLLICISVYCQNINLGIWSHWESFLEFLIYLLLVLLRTGTAAGERGSRTCSLNPMSLLILSWRHLIVQCSDVSRHRKNSTAVVQTQNPLQNVVLSPLLSLPAFCHLSIQANLLLFWWILRVTCLQQFLSWRLYSEFLSILVNVMFSNCCFDFCFVVLSVSLFFLVVGSWIIRQRWFCYTGYWTLNGKLGRK